MTGLLPSGAITELESSDPQVYVTLEVDLPDGTLYLSKAPVNSAARGPADTRVVQFGRLSYKVAPLQHALMPVNTSVVLSDVDFAVSNLIGKDQQFLNAAARMYLESPNFARHQILGGYVVDARSDQVGQWTFELKTRDSLLDTYIPRYELNVFDFANLDKGAKGTHRSHRRVVSGTTLGGYPPIVYGMHDDFSDGAAGAIPLPLVDTTAFIYLVSIGWTNPIRVYSAGVLKTVTTDYTVSRTTVNGRYYTIVTFLADQGTNAVTADVEGYDTVGDGTGTLIYDPVSVMLHFITNFILNDYSRGLWTATDATFFDTASWTAVQGLLNDRAGGAAFTCSRYLSNQVTGKSALEEFCQSFGLLPYWTNAGLLALAIDDPTMAYPDTYPLSPFIRWEDVRGLRQRRDAGKQAHRVIATFETITSGGTGTSSSTSVPKEMWQIEVYDANSAANQDDHISLAWGPSVFP